jgi:hypothetical protein
MSSARRGEPIDCPLDHERKTGNGCRPTRQHSDPSRCRDKHRRQRWADRRRLVHWPETVFRDPALSTSAGTPKSPQPDAPDSAELGISQSFRVYGNWILLKAGDLPRTSKTAFLGRFCRPVYRLQRKPVRNFRRSDYDEIAASTSFARKQAILAIEVARLSRNDVGYRRARWRANVRERGPVVASQLLMGGSGSLIQEDFCWCVARHSASQRKVCKSMKKW